MRLLHALPLIILILFFLGQYFHLLSALNGAEGKDQTTTTIAIEADNGASSAKCSPRHFPSSDSFVCVCNATFCDHPEQIGNLESDNKVVVFLSDAAQFRLHKFIVPMKRQKKNEKLMAKNKKDKTKSRGTKNNFVHIRVNARQQFQEVLGFGGAFTDAAGFNLDLLNVQTRRALLRAYFDKQIGIRYTIGRVPIASCDFSTRVYSYCETPGDFDMDTFALANEDLQMKIPHIQAAMQFANKLRLFASPWSAPAWMKTTGKMQGGGSLRGTLHGPYYEAYARYFRRFFEEYARQGNITFWGLTLENEPQYGRYPDYEFQAMWISPEMQRDFANQVLAPALKQSPASSHVLIMAHDDDRNLIYDAALKIFGPKNANVNGDVSKARSSSSVAGLAFHWYSFYNHSVLSQLHELYPDRFLLSTEACTGWTGPAADRGPSLGNWTRAWMYGRDIARNLRNWAIGWTDWNLCLDLKGGPNWVKNFVDSPIIVNISASEFYKQPMFYAMTHFSRFIPPGSVRIDSQMISSSMGTVNSGDELQVEFVAFRTPTSSERVLVILSNADEPMEIIVKEEVEKEKGKAKTNSAHISMPPKSFATLIWAKGK